MKNKIFKKALPALTTISIAVPAISLSSCAFEQKSKDVDPVKPTALPTKKIKASSCLDNVNFDSTNEPLIFKNDSTSEFSIWVYIPNDTTQQGNPIYEDLELYYRTISSRGRASDWETVTGPGQYGLEIPIGQGLQICAKWASKTNEGTFSIPDHPIHVYFDADSKVKLGGSLQSLLCTTESDISGGDITVITELSKPDCFANLFESASILETISPALLPFKKLSVGCYKEMFKDCNNLKNTPSLIAEELVESCYEGMFKNCSSLSTIDLPARKLAKNCYANIVQDCITLSTISLGYVGNFNENYFKDWVKGIDATTETSKTSTIYYTGEDTEVSDKALPLGFKTEKMNHILNQTKVLTFVEDENKTGTLSSTAKNKLRAYNDQKFSELDIATTIIPQYVTDKGDISKWFHKESSTKYTEIEGINDLTVEELPGTTLAPKFGFSEVVALKDYTQVEVEQTSSIRYGDYTSAAGKVQVAEYVAGKEIEQLDWQDLPTSKYQGSTYNTLTLTKNKRYILRGTIKNTESNKTNIQIPSGKVSIAGNAMSLIRETIDGANPTELRNFAFDRLFADSTGLTSVSSTFLCDENGNPYELKPMCYSSMFNGCTNLLMDAEQGSTNPVTPLILGATTSAGGCYNEMFKGCKSIKTAPTVCFGSTDTMQPYYESSTNWYYGVCGHMFEGCTALVSANYTLNPEKIGAAGYTHMFAECKNLKNAPSINAHTLDASNQDGLGACSYMFKYCYGLEIAAPFSYSGAGEWTAGAYSMTGMYYMGDNKSTGSQLKTAPILKFKFDSGATLIYKNCFKGCAQLDINTSSGTMFFDSSLGSCSENLTGYMFGSTKNYGNNFTGKCPSKNTKYYFK